MSDIRDELEKNFASADRQSDVQKGELKDSNEILENNAHDKKLYAAPKSYTKQFQENFQSLSPEWQEYLSSREMQIQKGFSDISNKLNAYKWADKLFADRQERLNASGFEKPQAYFEQLVAADDALWQNPKKAIAELEEIYGVQNENDNKEKIASDALLSKLWENLALAQKDFNDRRQNAAFFDVKRFAEAVGEDGNLSHPFYEIVKGEMQKALKSGSAQSLEDAYAQAVWAKPETRNQLLQDKINQVLEQKINAAQTAKEAALLANSKTTEKPKELTLREELEAQFRKEF